MRRSAALGLGLITLASSLGCEAAHAPAATNEASVGDAGAVAPGASPGNGPAASPTPTPDGCDAGESCTPAGTAPTGTNPTGEATAVTTPTTLTSVALIVTQRAYVGALTGLAQMHTLTGAPTQVVAVEDICAASGGGCDDTNACNDTSKAIKTYLAAQQAQNPQLAQVVLAGDMTVVPSRQTSDSFSNSILGVSYAETFYSDYYFADLSEWDTNGDCVYGDPTTDAPDYLPELAVTRISFSSAGELTTYITKAEAYVTGYDVTRVGTALFLSNVATQITVPLVNETIPVDSAIYFELPGRTLSTLPASFAVTKLYSSLEWPDAMPLTVDSEQAAFQAGSNLVVHSGHGEESALTVEQDGSNEFSGAMASALVNTQYPIMISCACQAATFADGDGCAGQNFITAPGGGGVGYLGNSTIGLGIAGGMQLLDGFLRYAFGTANPTAGAAVMAGHANLPTSDSIDLPALSIGSFTLTTVDADSWRWTQKAATYLGDGLLPIYPDPTITAAPTFTVSAQPMGTASQISFSASAPVTGALAVAVGSSTYALPLDGSGNAVSIVVSGNPSQLAYGFSSPSTLATYQVVTLR